MASVQIEISATRSLAITGRLVAGETAELTITGATPSALYLVAPDQTVVAACESFTPTGGGSGGTGFIPLATEQVAALFANIPAGRMVAVWALINDADGGVAGAGWIPVVSAPMPDALVDLDVDFYLRASQIGAGLAIVDGKLICTVNPDNYLTKTEAAATYATQTALAAKYSKPAGGIPATDLAASVQTSLGKADTALEAGAVAIEYDSSGGYSYYEGDYCTHGGKLWVCLDSDVSGEWDQAKWALVVVMDELIHFLSLKADAADLRYALDAMPREPDPVTGEVQLDDRTANYVGLGTATAVTLLFPGYVENRVRDFTVRLDSLATGSGNVTLTLDPEVTAVFTPDGSLPDVPLGKVTALYFSEVMGTGMYLLRGETLESATLTQGGN